MSATAPIFTSDVTHQLRKLAAAAIELADTLDQDDANVWTTAQVGLYRPLVYDVQARSDTTFRMLVEHLRDVGASWADIGGLLGISKQSAHERFSRFTNDQHGPE